MPLYQIPLLFRSTKVGKYNFKVKCLHVDEVGLFVYYDDEKQLDPDFIRRHITLRAETKCFIETDSIERAIDIFYREWEGASIGGDCLECKALWIDESKEAMELPHCELMRRNKEDQFICGELVESGNGEFGMCVLEGYDAPEDCPMADFWDRVYDMRKAGTLPVEGRRIREIKLVRAADVIKKSKDKEQRIPNET